METVRLTSNSMDIPGGHDGIRSKSRCKSTPLRVACMKMVHFASVISRHGHFLGSLSLESSSLTVMAINGWNEIWSHLYWLSPKGVKMHRNGQQFQPPLFYVPFLVY